jgi:hypothetical protein
MENMVKKSLKISESVKSKKKIQHMGQKKYTGISVFMGMQYLNTYICFLVRKK